MSSGESTWRLTTSFASRLGSHLPVIDEVVTRLKHFDWCEKDIFAIQLALEESITNAAKHGNKLDHSKSVYVQCEVSDSQFWAHIRDEGEGFCPEDVPDPTDDDNITAAGGRGVLLIKAYMTDVRYIPPGNCVTLLKLRYEDASGDPSPEAGQ